MTLSPENKKEGMDILNPKELLACAQDHSSEGRARLADAVAHFFEEQNLSLTEQTLASEILLNLIRQAERDLREALSERLSIHPDVPAELVVHLANDEISVARHVLLHSPVLNDVDLIYIITSKGREHWQQIAKRDTLSPIVAERLIDTHDPETILNLVDNQRVNLQKASMKKLVKAALRSEELQAPLLRRPEIDTEIAVELYMVVSQAMRRELAEKYPISAHALEEALGGLVQELGSAARGVKDTTPEMVSLAKKFEERKDITADLMVKTLRRGQFGFFAALFSERTGLAPQYIGKLLQKEGGKPFVVACRYIGMMKTEFASIFLLSRGMRAGDKIVDQRELAMALKNFDALGDFDVQRVMGAWLKNPEMI